MVLSSITESGSMAAPAAPPRSPRSAANGPGGGGGGSGGGGGGSRTHYSCQPARAAGSSALPLRGRKTRSGDYNSRQPPRLARPCGSKKPPVPLCQGLATGCCSSRTAGLECGTCRPGDSRASLGQGLVSAATTCPRNPRAGGLLPAGRS